MTTYKSIAYAYSTSPMAKHLGFCDDGCFYVQQRRMNDAGEWYTRPMTGVEGFKKANNPDLISLFLECDGEICPMFLCHGNQDALSAIK